MGRFSEFMKPMCLRDVLSEICHRWGIEKKIKEYSAMSQWSQVVGERIADKARPTGVENGRLFVHVDSSSWRNELTFMKKEIMDKLNRTVGTPVIQDIVFSGRKGATKVK